MKPDKIQHPNVLLVMVDQLAWNAMGALGGAAKTPNLDALCGESASFINAYCPSPLCVPSRAAFMTGKLPRRLGVYDNGSELAATQPTIAHHLVRAGYRTILAGKMHFVGPDQHHGFQERLTGDISLPGLGLTPDWRRGAYPNEGSSVSRLRQPNVVDWTLQLAFDEEVQSVALNRLRRLRLEGERFFMCASFAHPHDPFRITREYWDRYEDAEVPPPSAPARPAHEHHPYNRWIQTHHEAESVMLDEATVRANRRAYLAMVSYVDDKVGDLLGELERLGLAEDTVVIFTSDHGEMLGEHGMWFKRTFFDAATKVPLLIRWPGRVAAGVRREVVSLVDLSATLLELCTVPGAAEWIQQMDGDSLAPLLGLPARPLDCVHGAASPGEGVEGGGEGENLSWPPTGPSSWKDKAFGEYLAEGTTKPMLYLRRGRYKYVHVHGEEPLLFDLAEDPHELHDLAGEQQYEGVQQELARELLRDVDTAELEARVIASQRERLAIFEAQPDRFAWAHHPARDALELYRPARK